MPSKANTPTIQEQFDEVFLQRSEEGLRSITMLAVKPTEDAQDKGRALSSIVREAWADAFLVALTRHGTFLAATRVAGVARQTVYELIKQSPEFARAVETAKEEFAEMLEAVAIIRAMQGSERLLEFLLKGALPGKYREGPSVAVQVHSGPIVVDIVADASGADPVPVLPNTTYFHASDDSI